MSPETDRIPVPTNGKGPHPVKGLHPVNGPVHDPAPVPGPAEPTERTDPAETTIVFTPTQLAVGFGIIASLVLLLVRRMRGSRRSRSRGPFGRG
jgi:hypothetical protein